MERRRRLCWWNMVAVPARYHLGEEVTRSTCAGLSAFRRETGRPCASCISRETGLGCCAKNLSGVGGRNATVVQRKCRASDDADAEGWYESAHRSRPKSNQNRTAVDSRVLERRIHKIRAVERRFSSLNGMESATQARPRSGFRDDLRRLESREFRRTEERRPWLRGQRAVLRSASMFFARNRRRELRG